MSGLFCVHVLQASDFSNQSLSPILLRLTLHIDMQIY